MAGDIRAVKSSCLCGTIAHDITLPISALPLPAAFCHCSACRHMSGTLCNTSATLPRSYRIPQDIVDRLQPYEFSDRNTHYFCSKCGTPMLVHCKFYHYGTRKDDGDGWEVYTGTLDKAEGVFEVAFHEFVADTVDGGFSDFIPNINGKQIVRRRRRPGNMENELPLYWQSPDRLSYEPKDGDRLHAHCKCGGVEFWIAKPSERSAMGKAPFPDLIVPFHHDGPGPEATSWWLRAGGTKYLAGCCSCNSCRLAVGMEWVEWAFVPTVEITLDKDGKVPFSREFGTLKSYRSSPDVARHFCGTCGATAFWDGDGRPQLIDVAVGLLDAPEGARAESWLVWRTARLSYREDAMPRAESLTLALEEGLKAYGEMMQGEPQDSVA